MCMTRRCTGGLAPCQLLATSLVSWQRTWLSCRARLLPRGMPFSVHRCLTTFTSWDLRPLPSSSPDGVGRPKLEFQARALFCRFGSMDALVAAFVARNDSPGDAALVAAAAAPAVDLVAAAAATAAEAAAQDQGAGQVPFILEAAFAAWSDSLKGCPSSSTLCEAAIRCVPSRLSPPRCSALRCTQALRLRPCPSTGRAWSLQSRRRPQLGYSATSGTAPLLPRGWRSTRSRALERLAVTSPLSMLLYLHSTPGAPLNGDVVEFNAADISGFAERAAHLGNHNKKRIVFTSTALHPEIFEPVQPKRLVDKYPGSVNISKAHHALPELTAAPHSAPQVLIPRKGGTGRERRGTSGIGSPVPISISSVNLDCDPRRNAKRPHR